MRLLWLSYLVLLHLALAVALAKSSFFYDSLLRAGIDPPSYSRTIKFAQSVHQQKDPLIPSGASIFLGDSITAGLVTAAVSPYSVNLGIPGQRTDHLLSAIDSYKALARAGRVFLLIGTNDVAQGRSEGLKERYRLILSKIPAHVPVVFSAIPPINRPGKEQAARQAARDASEVCAADSRCTFVDAYKAVAGGGESSPGVHEDGIHLTADGYRRWMEALSTP